VLRDFAQFRFEGLFVVLAPEFLGGFDEAVELFNKCRLLL
jgi:hypothetical protein